MMDARDVIAMTFIWAIFLILAIILILVRARTLEMKLLLIGIFMGIAAAVQSNVAGVSVNAGQVTLATGVGPAPLMKFAVILTLAGVGMMLLSRATPPAATGSEKERSHGE
jgi:cell division protein FtsW (lipid II flippase)